MQSPDRQQLLNLLAENDKKLAEMDVKIIEDERQIAELKEFPKTNSRLLMPANHTTHPDCQMLYRCRRNYPLQKNSQKGIQQGPLQEKNKRESVFVYIKKTVRIDMMVRPRSSTMISMSYAQNAQVWNLPDLEVQSTPHYNIT